MALNLKITMHWVNILTILIVSNYEYKMSFHLHVFFSFLHHCSVIFRLKIFYLLIRCLPKYFILFNALINGIFFKFPFCIVHCLHIEMLLISVCCNFTGFISFNFFRLFLRIFYMDDHVT